MVYAEFGGQTECIMGNSKIENTVLKSLRAEGQFHYNAFSPEMEAT